MNRRLRRAALGWLASGLLRLFGATWRVEILGTDPRVEGPGPEERAPGGRRSAARQADLRQEDTRRRAPAGPHLAALLHQSFVIAAWLFRDADYAVAISRSRDGDRVSEVLRHLGYAEPARGSSSRGGTAALIGLLRRLAAGTTVAVLVDGPRGPAAVAKPGIAALARRSERPIQPVALAARPAIRLASWDRTILPLPFARVVCLFGSPLAPPSEGPEEDDEARAQEVGQRLAELQAQADAHLRRDDRTRGEGRMRSDDRAAAVGTDRDRMPPRG